MMANLSQPATFTTQANQWIEITLQSSQKYKNPFKALFLDAIFTTPTGTQCRIPAFWAGGNRWAIRYASANIGTHPFITECSDTENTGLHHQSGQVSITAYTGDNPLFTHGAIKVAEDRHHFAHADGTPFLWLGDTWWMGLCNRLHWPEDFQALTLNRKAKGFNVIQLVAGLYPDMSAFDDRGKSASGFAWEKDYSSINPAFFDEADQRIFYLVEQGLVPCILGAWGYYLPWLGIENMQLHWRYIIARWGALPVVWAAAGEQTMPWYLESDKASHQTLLKNDWSDVMAMIREIDGFKRLLTTHPMTSARESVNHIELIDFEMQQTGHASPTPHHASSAMQGWLETPIMPVISAESRYEALEITPHVTTKDVREAFWAHCLNSGCAGHTYGANGIWQVNLPHQPFGKSPSGHNWGTMPWQQAMHLPAADQLTIAKNLLMALPWHTLQAYPLPIPFTARMIQKIKHPRSKRILAKFLPNTCNAHPIAAARSTNNRLIILYTISLRAFDVKLDSASQTLLAYWVDPSNGEKINIKTKLSNNPITLKPPGKNRAGDDDWLCVVQST
jgi:hypothetical protein